MNVEEKIKSLGLSLPSVPAPAGSYCPVMVSNGFAFVSGQISRTAEGKIISGKAGADLTLDQAREAARAAAINVLSVIHHLVGWTRVEKILRVAGYVQSAPDFYDIPQVMNGASDLFVEVFGERGVHARSAVGVASLPLNAAVEIEVILKTKNQGLE